MIFNYLNNTLINTLIGIFGIALILLAFILDEFVRKINRDTILYNLLNVFGSLFLVYYALSLNSWPFLILNAVWMSAALVKIERIISCRKKKSKRN